MKSKGIGVVMVASVFLLSLGGCSSAHGNAAAEAPPPVKVVRDVDVSLLTVEHPERFVLSTAAERVTVSKLVATGTVSPDISRSIPVISLASGRTVRFTPSWATRCIRVSCCCKCRVATCRERFRTIARQSMTRGWRVTSSSGQNRGGDTGSQN